MRRHSSARKPRRRGVQTLELILVAPVVVLVLLAILEYGMLNITQGAITHAATVGAREAGKESTFTVLGTYDPVQSIVDEVNEVLATVDIAIDGRPGALMVIKDDDGTEYTSGDAGGFTYSLPTPAAGEVSVTLFLKFSATKFNGSPLINAFHYCGFTFAGKQFRVSSLVKTEL
jgi:hypothetical protein